MKIWFVSAGAPRHGKNLQKETQQFSDAEGWGWETEFYEWQNDGYESLPYDDKDWIWSMGNFGNVFFWMSQLRCKTVAHWIGTDVLQHLDMQRQGIPDPVEAATIHIADAMNLQTEVQEFFHVDCGFVRSIPPQTYSPKPITRWDNTLAYVPPGREDFFRWAWIVELARDYPDITFNIIPRPQRTVPEPNVNEMPEISGKPRDELYEKCFAYLRPIEHDGVGLTMIEFAQLGRWVFHTDTRIPHVLPARNAMEMEVYLDDILSKKKSPPPDVSDYYIREFGYPALRNDMYKLKRQMDSKA